MKNKFSIFVCMFSMFASGLYAQTNLSRFEDGATNTYAKESSFNAFLEYMKGKSRISFNFVPNIPIYGVPFILDIGISQIDLVGEANYEIGDPVEFITDLYNYDGSLGEIPDNGDIITQIDTHFKAKDGSFGMSFSYDFTPLAFMGVSVDVGFSLGGLKGSVDLHLEEGYSLWFQGVTLVPVRLSLDYRVVSYSLGLKFYPNKNAPYGFYLMPKLGATFINIDILGDENVFEFLDDYDFPSGLTSTGVYASVELGWHIHLLPNLTKELPIEIGLDIALCDIGYYFVPWTGELASTSVVEQMCSDYPWLLNIRAMILPKIGVSIRF